MRGLILIVDDEHAIVETLTELLGFEGFEILGASNGQAALQAMAARRPSVVLLDVMMPVLDGLQTLEVMRRDPALADVPVILMSAVPEPESPSGVRWNAYLRKPFRAPQLLAAIAGCLPKM